MSEMPETTHIIIPTYEPDEVLTAAVDAALGQRNAGVLVTVIDDGTRGGIERYIVKFFDDSRFRYIRLSHNVGPSDARNIALLLSGRAACITFHDDDDLPKTDKISHQLKQLEEEWTIDPIRFETIAFDIHDRYDIAVNKVIRRERDGQTHITGEMIYLVRDILPNSYNFFGVPGRKYSLHYPSALFRKKVFTQIGGFYPSLYGYEDDELAVRTMLSGMNHHFDDTPLYHFNKNNTSITYNTDAKHKQRIRALYEHVQLMRIDSSLARQSFITKYRQPISVFPGIDKIHNLALADLDMSIPAKEEVTRQLKKAVQYGTNN